MPEIPPEAFRYVAEGKTIQAVKIVRDATGLGLRDAKLLVDRIVSGEISTSAAGGPAPEASAGAGTSQGSEDHLVAHVSALLDAGQSIEAIRHVRETTGSDLVEATALVDRIQARRAEPDGTADALAAHLVDDGRAVQEVRSVTGASLAEAKVAVDRVAPDPPPGGGLSRLVILVFVAALALALLVVLMGAS